MESEPNLEAQAVELIAFLKRPTNTIEEINETLAILSSSQTLFPVFLLLIQKQDPANDQILTVLSDFIYRKIRVSQEEIIAALAPYAQTISELALAGIGIPYFSQYFTIARSLFEENGFFLAMFEQLLSITKECVENQFSNPNQVQCLASFLQVTDTYRRSFRQDEDSPIALEPYLVEFFPTFFTLDNILNPNNAQAVKAISESCYLMFRYSFPFFLQTNVFDNILDIILFLDQIVAEERPIDKILTNVLIQITKSFVNEFFDWIANLENRYVEEKAIFLQKYTERLIVQFATIAKDIQHYFTYDIYYSIPQYLLLSLMRYLLIFDPQLSDAEIETFYELALNYMELPQVVKQDFSDNPIMYYQNAYYYTYQIGNEPRWFSITMLHHLLNQNTAKTMSCLFASTGNQRIPFWGFAIKHLENHDFFSELLQENEAGANALISEILGNIEVMIKEPTENEYDALFLLISSCRFLPDETKQNLLDRAKAYLNGIYTLSQSDPDSINEMHKFLFTFGCSIIQALLAVEFPIGEDLPMIISIILQNFDACSSDDAINAIFQMISMFPDFLRSNSNQLIAFFLHTIRVKTGDFCHDGFAVEESENMILDKVFDAVELCLGSCDQEPLALFDDLFNNFFANKESINDLNEYFRRLIHSVVSSGWSEYPQILSRLLNESLGCENLFPNEPVDFFLDPFYIFIAKDKEAFAKWESLPQFLQLMINLFSTVPLSNQLDMVPCETFYFTSKMFSLMIMSGIAFDVESLYASAIQRLQFTDFPSPKYPDMAVIYYGCFDIITTVVMKKGLIAKIPDDVMGKFQAFVNNGFVTRISEQVRYTMFCQILKGLENPEIGGLMDLLSSTILRGEKKQEIIDLDWFEHQKMYGNF